MVVVDSGPIGAYLTAELGRRGFPGPMVLYGAEPTVANDRVRRPWHRSDEVDRADMDLPDC